MSNLIIVGAGGLGLEVAQYAQDIARSGTTLTLKGYLDDSKKPGALIDGYAVLGGTDAVLDTQALYVIAVGAPDGRRTLAEKLAAKGAVFINLIHPSCVVARTAHLGIGMVAAPFAFVGARAIVGDHCLLNIYSSVGHEANVGNYAVLSPYAGINGGAIVGEEAFLGSQTSIMPRAKVGNRSKIAAGAVVYRDIPADATAIGNPAAFRAVK